MLDSYNRYMAEAGDSTEVHNLYGNRIEELGAEISDLDSWLSGYKQNQKDSQKSEYDSIKTAPDYAEKSSAVTDGQNGQLYDYINDIGDTRDRIYNELGSENNWYGMYEYLSPDEVGTYNYLNATQGTESADKYLKTLDNTLNQRIGTRIAESTEGNTAVQVMSGFFSGLDQSMSKLSRAISGNEEYKSSHEYAKELIKQDLKDSGTAKVIYDVLDGVGNAVPSIVLSYMTGGLLASAGVGAKTASIVGSLVSNTGNAVLSAGEVYNGLKEQGYSDAQAGLYAATSTAVNGALQALLGSIPGLSIENGVVSSTINGINSAILQAGARIGTSALSQGATQAVQSVVSDLLRQAMLGGQSGVDWEEAGYQAILGVLTGGGFAAAQEAGKAVGGALDRAENKLSAREAEETYSPINSGSLDESIANTFRSGTYTKKVLTEDTTFYRVYGGGSGEVGLYMSRTPQLGGMQSQLDLALNPKWGNAATHVTKVTVPKGTVIYEGFAAPQAINGGAGSLMGGGNQIYIPEVNASWFGK